MKKFVSLFMVLAFFAVASIVQAAALTGTRVLIDFGPANDDDGRATVSPDINGNYWNSWRPLPGNSAIPAPTSFVGTVVDSYNNATNIGLVMTNSFDSNGIIHGGLLAPSAALLGDFAIASATEDYWFESVGGAAVLISGLNPNQTYDLRMFGTRENTRTRITRYTAFVANGSQ